MKVNLFLILTILSMCLRVYGQEIAINEVKAIPAYTLSSEEMQKDANGDVCAMINVYLNTDGAIFEGSSVVNTSKSQSPYKVFVVPGASSITIKHKDYLPLNVDFIDLGIGKLQSGSVYSLNLIVEKNLQARATSHSNFTLEEAENGNAEAQCYYGKKSYHGLDGTPDYETAKKWLEKSSDNGNSEATYYLGLCYLYGKGTEKDAQKAIELFHKSADDNHAMSQFRYAINIHNDPQKFQESIDYFEKSAAQGVILSKMNLANIYLFYDPNDITMMKAKGNIGFPDKYDIGLSYLKECEEEGIIEAYTALGRLYEEGIGGVNQDYKKAFDYYNEAIEKGSSSAYDSLGRLYFTGSGVKKDYKKAVKYFQTAAEKGIAPSYYNLGLCYYTGGPGVKSDINKAVTYFQQAADNGLAVAETNLGNLYLNGAGIDQNFEKAFELFTRGAEHGDAFGLVNLGNMYLNGMHVSQDTNKAIEFFQKAADKGNYLGYVNLGVMYSQGQGVTKDSAKATEYLLKASDINPLDGTALYNLGCIYYFGDETGNKDYRKAFGLFQESSSRGFAPAQYNLGVMYLNGEFVAADQKEGLKYIKLAANQNYPLAVEYLQKNPSRSAFSEILNTVTSTQNNSNNTNSSNDLKDKLKKAKGFLKIK